MSPEPFNPAGSQSPRKSSIVKLTVNPNKVSNIQSAPPNPSPVRSGATSDGEATGGEMSDGGKKKKKIKLVFTGTPNGSRAGSPAAGSRSGSPAAASGMPVLSSRDPTLSVFEEPIQTGGLSNTSLLSISCCKILTYVPGASPGRAQSPAGGPVQAHEVLAALPASGITLKELLKGFAGRVQSAEDKKHFISLVKDNSKYGPDKLLRPKQ